MPSRRQLLVGMGTLCALSAVPRLSLASTGGNQRLIVVIVRGGLDGLALLPPHGDRDYATARGKVALPLPGAADGIIDLDGFFGLHPAMAPLLPMYRSVELLGVHAVGLPNTQRSHFEAQDMLESGSADSPMLKTGWLNRALSLLPSNNELGAVAIGQGIPLILRGPAAATSLQPGERSDATDPFLEMVAELYRSDALLDASLQQSMMTRALLAESNGGKRGRRKHAHTAGQLLRAAEGPRVAVLELGGMDTHSRQKSTLNTRLRQLAESLLMLQESLQESWSQTAVVVITEFGRTVSSNGTGGTDHGTGAAALLLGGAISGGRVQSDWPGLRDLHQHRDLKITTDLRSVLGGVLKDHLGISGPEIFPGAPPPQTGLIRQV